MDRFFFEKALDEARKSADQGEVPIGAVNVKDGVVIAEGHNNRIFSKDPTAHAEIMAIREASLKLGDWRLNGCDMYVTLKPCDMCLGVIHEARLDNVYFLLDRLSYKKPYYRTKVRIVDNAENNDLSGDYKDFLSNFFKENCKR